MRFKVVKNTVLLFVLLAISCGNKKKNNSDIDENNTSLVEKDSTIVVGANRTELYLPLLNGKRVGIVANQTSVIFHDDNDYTHLVDSLLKLDVTITSVFAPEHGFRGTADAGELIKDGVDIKTGLPIVSLYGKNKKPSETQLQDIDLVVFDIQDVGARFYTYISSLHYVMEACAEMDIPVLILDRPNPNGHYIDGPILELEYQSFVGMHPIPIVHGMTIGEYAQMINGEGWLKNKIRCELEVIPVKNYNRQRGYNLPIKPSPNLPNEIAINLYPSLCLFEGTNISIGRGTDKQFQIVGSPYYSLMRHNYEFTPMPNEGAKFPKHEGKLCRGFNLSNNEKQSELNLSWLLDFYKANKQYANNQPYFNDFFTKLAGTRKLQEQIENGMIENEIKMSWQEGLSNFRELRQPYLLYK